MFESIRRGGIEINIWSKTRTVLGENEKLEKLWPSITYQEPNYCNT